MDIKQRTFPKGPQAISKAADQSGVVVEATNEETSGYDVYLAGVGTGIDPAANANYVTFQLRVNRQPFYPFQNMTSQIGSITLPQKFDEPIYLGRGVVVDIFASVAAGATGNTTLAGTFHLLLKKPS